MRAHTSPLRPGASGTRLAVAALAAPLALAGAAMVPADAAAPSPRPGLRLFAAEAEHEVSRPAGERVWVELPIYTTPVGGTFDLRVRRPDYFSPIEVSQVVHEPDGTETAHPIDAETRSWSGIRRFAEVTVAKPNGTTSTSPLLFCPNSWQPQRLDDPGSSDTPTFPVWCDGSSLTKGMTWGIDKGWAVPVSQMGAISLKGPAGEWTVTVTLAERYQELFGVDPADATSSVTYHVSDGDFDDHAWRTRSEVERAQVEGARARSGAQPEQTPGPRSHLRVVEAAPTDSLPDLQALPSFAITTHHRKGKDVLAFASTVWVGGTSKLDIEGFRRAGEDVMDAYQYFYDGDEAVARAKVGELEYDTRRGHHHWHLLQFARYRLLDKDEQHVRLSKKQSFCLAPTDPVDLATSGAALRQESEDLGSACGGASAMWIRETLPLGWGDTYYQNRGGQAFNITDVPNGTYYVAVEANPTGELFESDTTNNVALREIHLKGKPGNRRVCVPAVGVIRAEGTCRDSAG